MSYKIITYNNKYLDEIINIWNNTLYKKTIIDKMDKDLFKEKIINNKSFKKEGFLLLILNDELIGYGLANYNESNLEGYISFIVIKDNMQRKGYGTLLLNYLSNYLKDKNVKYIRQIFTNPINLTWNINKNINIKHPNMPGVLINSIWYLFLLNNGFNINGPNQDVYYLNLENFKINDKVKSRITNLKKEGITITYYNKDKHFGYEKLFKDLNNPAWLKAFEDNINNKMLVVLKDNLIIGWTGPIIKTKDNRGYFSGIGISPKISSKGIGTALFNKLILSFKEINVKYMTLFTGSNNVARYIYLNANFKIKHSFAILRKDL